MRSRRKRVVPGKRQMAPNIIASAIGGSVMFENKRRESKPERNTESDVGC